MIKSIEYECFCRRECTLFTHFVKTKAAATIITGASFILLRLLLRILCLNSFASSHMNPWCAEIAVYTFCTSCIEVAKKNYIGICTWKTSGFIKRICSQREKKIPLKISTTLVLTLKWMKLGFKTWILDPKYEV